MQWSRGELRQTAEQAINKAIQAFRQKAVEHNCHLAVGTVKCKGDTWLNSALLFDPTGNVICNTTKHFLWHFDGNWFSPGSEFGVCETPWGKVGILICADGRPPEVARILRLKGTRILLDLTNWTTTGKEPSKLTNPQVEYIMRTRALENQMWVVAANKVGIEQDSVAYCGSSCVINPEGEIVARASSDKAETLFVNIPLDEGVSGVLVDSRLNPVVDRKSKEYLILTEPTDSLPVYSTMKEELVPVEKAVLAAAVQVTEAEAKKAGGLFTAGTLKRLVNILAEEKVRLVVFPELSHSVPQIAFQALFHAVLDESKNNPNMVLLLTGPESYEGKTYKSTFVVSCGEVIGKYRKVHLETTEKPVLCPGDQGLPVFSTPVGNIGIMLGYEGLLPEVARVLTLKGAELIAWPASFAVDRHELLAKTRAVENRVFVVVANSSSEGIGESIIVDPAGIVLAQAFRERTQIASAFCNLSAARLKAIIPGTDAILDRQPFAYRELIG